MLKYWPQIIALCIMFGDLMGGALMDGKDKEGKYSFWVEAIIVSIEFFILYMGGFFNER